MKQWEYLFTEPLPRKEAQHKADDHGESGWELVSHTTLILDGQLMWTMSFKRLLRIGID